MPDPKYRAWVIAKKKMYPVHAIFWDDSGEVLHVSTARSTVPNTVSYEAFEVILLQCTGLADKNGTDIYEGDIVECGGLVLPITVNDYHGHRFMAGEDALCKVYANDGVVIGNVHANPELLEKQ